MHQLKMSEKKTPLVTLEELEFEDPIPIPNSLRRPLAVRPMVLMGTGPTNSTKRVMEALCKPAMGLYSSEYNQVWLQNFSVRKLFWISFAIFEHTHWKILRVCGIILLSF